MLPRHFLKLRRLAQPHRFGQLIEQRRQPAVAIVDVRDVGHWLLASSARSSRSRRIARR